MGAQSLGLALQQHAGRGRKTPHISASIAVVLVVGALSGCAAAERASEATTASSTPEPTTLAEPTAAVVAPLDLAVTAVRRFCRPDLPESRWIADLDPLLTLEAASAYATVNPARVQCSQVVLPARVAEGDGFTQVVDVRTDLSPYRVLLSRSSLSDSWLVFRIAPASEK